MNGSHLANSTHFGFYGNFLQEISVPFAPFPKFPEFLVEWKAHELEFPSGRVDYSLKENEVE